MPANETLAQPLSERFERALVYAAQAHREQSRKGTQIPYVSHVMAVAGLVLEHGGTESQAIAALLHDVLEDQGMEQAPRIAAEFGDDVLRLVEACTDATVGRGEKKPAWRPRKEAYVARVRVEPPSTKLVSAADKLHNARAVLADYRQMGEALWARFNGGRDGSLWYYEALVQAYREGEQTPGLRALVDELERVVKELRALASRG